MSDNFLQIVNRVLRESCDDEVTTIVSTVGSPIAPHVKSIIKYINEGYRIAYTKAFKNPDAEKSVKITLTVNNNPFSLIGTGIQSISGLGVKGLRPIVIKDFLEFENYYYFQPTNLTPSPNIVTGVPQVASFFANKLYIWPELDKPYELEFFAKSVFTPMVNDSDIPAVCDDVITNYALYKQFSYDGDPRQQNSFTDYNLTFSAYLDSIADHSSLPPMIMPEDAY